MSKELGIRKEYRKIQKRQKYKKYYIWFVLVTHAAPFKSTRTIMDSSFYFISRSDICVTLSKLWRISLFFVKEIAEKESAIYDKL